MALRVPNLFLLALSSAAVASCSASQRHEADAAPVDARDDLADRGPGSDGGRDTTPVDVAAPDATQDASSAPDAFTSDGPSGNWIPETNSTDLPGHGDCANASVERVSLLPVRGASGATAMVADDTDLFVAAFDGSTGRAFIWAVPKLGGAPQIVHEDTDEIHGLARVDDVLLFAAGSNVNRVSTRGGQPTPISSAKPGGRSLTVVGDTLYWAADAVVSPWDGGVFAAPLTGGPSTALATGIRAKGLYMLAGVLHAIASDTPRDPNGALLRIPLPGGVPTRVGSANFAGTKALVGVDSEAFILSDSIYRIDLSTGGMAPLDAGPVDPTTHSIVAEGRQLYWTSDGIWPGTANISGGRVRRFDLDGGGLTEIAVCLPKPGPLAVDQQWVYWFNWLSGEILRAPR